MAATKKQTQAESQVQHLQLQLAEAQKLHAQVSSLLRLQLQQAEANQAAAEEAQAAAEEAQAAGVAGRAEADAQIRAAKEVTKQLQQQVQEQVVSHVSQMGQLKVTEGSFT